ncbi:uncharacterized protein VTP21DRAFT_2207 [Calcarisporiella thermophila]|uniref:uncharacterized protein n=1 Tax=Calcarisporiella thermophila TaxID=911321 RepID=UPI003743FE02
MPLPAVERASPQQQKKSIRPTAAAQPSPKGNGHSLTSKSSVSPELDSRLQALDAALFPSDEEIQQAVDSPELLLGVVERGAQVVDRWVEVGSQLLAEDEHYDRAKSLAFQSLDAAGHRLGSLASCLERLKELEKQLPRPPRDAETTRVLRMTMKAISDWNELIELLEDIKRRQIMDTMDSVQSELDDLRTILFQFQEQRQAAIAEGRPHILPPSQSLDILPSHWGQGSEGEGDAGDSWLKLIDGKMKPLYEALERLHTRLTTDANQQVLDPDGVLRKRYVAIQSQWETATDEFKEIQDELQDELKDGRWVSFFLQVAGQVDTMMNTLEEALGQSRKVIELLQHEKTGGHSPGKLTLPLTPSSKIRSRPVSLPPGLLDSIDPDSIQTFIKGFDAKRKYYISPVERMIPMLGNSLASKGPAIADSELSRRHTLMKQRWQQLKQELEQAHAQLVDLTQPKRDEPSNVSSPKTPTVRNNSNPSKIRLGTATSSRPRASSPSPSEPAAGTSARRYLSPPSNRRTSFLGQNTQSKGNSPHSSSELRPSSRASTVSTTSITSSPSALRSSRRLSSASTPGGLMQTRPAWNSSTKVEPLTQASSINRPISPHPPRSRTPVPATTSRSGRSSAMSRSRAPSVPPSLNTRARPVSQLGYHEASQQVLSPKPRPEQPDAPSMIPRPSSSLPFAQQSLLRPSTPTRPQSPARSQIPRPTTPSTPKTVGANRPVTPSRAKSPAVGVGRSQIPRPTTPSTPGSVHQYQQPPPVYRPQRDDPLDSEVARILAHIPLPVPCNRIDPGRYQFGDAGRSYLCRLVTSHPRGKPPQQKVLVRVGGGWQDLEIFLLEHAQSLLSDAIARNFTIGF